MVLAPRGRVLAGDRAAQVADDVACRRHEDVRHAQTEMALEVRVFCRDDCLAQLRRDSLVRDDDAALGGEVADQLAARGVDPCDGARRVVVERGDRREVAGEREQHAADGAEKRRQHEENDDARVLRETDDVSSHPESDASSSARPRAAAGATRGGAAPAAVARSRRRRPTGPNAPVRASRAAREPAARCRRWARAPEPAAARSRRVVARSLATVRRAPLPLTARGPESRRVVARSVHTSAPGAGTADTPGGREVELLRRVAAIGPERHRSYAEHSGRRRRRGCASDPGRKDPALPGCRVCRCDAPALRGRCAERRSRCARQPGRAMRRPGSPARQPGQATAPTDARSASERSRRRD